MEKAMEKRASVKGKGKAKAPDPVVEAGRQVIAMAWTTEDDHPTAPWKPAFHHHRRRPGLEEEPGDYAQDLAGTSDDEPDPLLRASLDLDAGTPRARQPRWRTPPHPALTPPRVHALHLLEPPPPSPASSASASPPPSPFHRPREGASSSSPLAPAKDAEAASLSAADFPLPPSRPPRSSSLANGTRPLRSLPLPPPPDRALPPLPPVESPPPVPRIRTGGGRPLQPLVLGPDARSSILSIASSGSVPVSPHFDPSRPPTLPLPPVPPSPVPPSSTLLSPKWSPLPPIPQSASSTTGSTSSVSPRTSFASSSGLFVVPPSPAGSYTTARTSLQTPVCLEPPELPPLPSNIGGEGESDEKMVVFQIYDGTPNTTAAEEEVGDVSTELPYLARPRSSSPAPVLNRSSSPVLAVNPSSTSSMPLDEQIADEPTPLPETKSESGREEDGSTAGLSDADSELDLDEPLEGMAVRLGYRAASEDSDVEYDEDEDPFELDDRASARGPLSLPASPRYSRSTWATHSRGTSSTVKSAAGGSEGHNSLGLGTVGLGIRWSGNSAQREERWKREEVLERRGSEEVVKSPPLRRITPRPSPRLSSFSHLRSTCFVEPSSSDEEEFDMTLDAPSSPAPFRGRTPLAPIAVQASFSSQSQSSSSGTTVSSKASSIGGVRTPLFDKTIRNKSSFATLSSSEGYPSPITPSTSLKAPSSVIEVSIPEDDDVRRASAASAPERSFRASDSSGTTTVGGGAPPPPRRSSEADAATTAPTRLTRPPTTGLPRPSGLKKPSAPMGVKRPQLKARKTSDAFSEGSITFATAGAALGGQKPPASAPPATSSAGPRGTSLVSPQEDSGESMERCPSEGSEHGKAPRSEAATPRPAMKKSSYPLLQSLDVAPKLDASSKATDETAPASPASPSSPSVTWAKTLPRKQSIPVLRGREPPPEGAVNPTPSIGYRAPKLRPLLLPSGASAMGRGRLLPRSGSSPTLSSLNKGPPSPALASSNLATPSTRGKSPAAHQGRFGFSYKRTPTVPAATYAATDVPRGARTGMEMPRAEAETMDELGRLLERASKRSSTLASTEKAVGGAAQVVSSSLPIMKRGRR